MVLKVIRNILKIVMGISVLLASLAIITAGLLEPKSKENLIRETSLSVFRIKTETSYATGFTVVTTTGSYMITNDHVCEGHLMIAEGQDTYLILDTTPILSDKNVDLCAAKLTLKKDIKFLPLANSSYYPQEIMVLGHPMAQPTTPSFGYEMEMLPDLLYKSKSSYISAVVYPGNSGSPVVNMQGEVVGVLNEGHNDTHYGRAISLANLKDFLKKVDAYQWPNQSN